MSPSDPQKDPDPANQTAAERARVLLELLRDQKANAQVSPLLHKAHTAAGTAAQQAQTPPPEAALRESARELLRRIGRKTAPKAPKTKGAMSPAVVRSTIAALVDGNRLGAEHPAVIAIVIENQPRSTQSAVMRALPGRTARQVRKALLALEQG